MQEFKELYEVNDVRYVNKSFLLIIYVVAGIAMVYISDPDEWAILHTYGNNYLRAMAFSMGVSLGLGIFIHYLNWRLDKKFNWLLNRTKRRFAQLTWTVLFPLAIATGANLVYFTVQGYGLSESTFFDRLFYLIFALLLVVSYHYEARFASYINRLIAQQNQLREKEEAAAMAEVAAQERALEEERANAQQILLPDGLLELTDVLLIYANHKFVLYNTQQSQGLNWNHSLTHTINQLPVHDFFRINQATIVPRSNIREVYIYTATTYEIELNFPEGQFVTVSQRAKKDFKAWYDGEILQKRHQNAKAHE